MNTNKFKGILPEKSEYKILFIGNSATYVNDIPKTLAELCNGKGIKLYQHQIVSGGKSLEQHARGEEIFEEISKGYDAVVIQENGNCIVDREQREKSLEAIRKIACAVNTSGAKLCYYVRPPYGIDLGGFNSFEQCRIFDDYFNHAAKMYSGDCIYVNRGFAYAIKKLNYNLWGDDNAHTNIHGAYLAVCIFYATLFGKTAAELEIAYGLSEDDSKALCQTADMIAAQGIVPWKYFQ